MHIILSLCVNSGASDTDNVNFLFRKRKKNCQRPAAHSVCDSVGWVECPVAKTLGIRLIAAELKCA